MLLDGTSRRRTTDTRDASGRRSMEACRLDGANADCRWATLDCAQAASAAAPSVRPSKRMTFGRPAITTLRNASTEQPAMPERLMEGISNPDCPAPRNIRHLMQAEP